MSDVNKGGNFGDGNFPEFISRERDRLRAEREQVFNQQKEPTRKLDAVNQGGAAGIGWAAIANATRQQTGGFT